MDEALTDTRLTVLELTHLLVSACRHLGNHAQFPNLSLYIDFMQAILLTLGPHESERQITRNNVMSFTHQ